MLEFFCCYGFFSFLVFVELICKFFVFDDEFDIFSMFGCMLCKGLLGMEMIFVDYLVEVFMCIGVECL